MGAAAAGADRSVPVRVQRLDAIAARAMAIPADGALLVRPDGVPTARWAAPADAVGDLPGGGLRVSWRRGRAAPTRPASRGTSVGLTFSRTVSSSMTTLPTSLRPGQVVHRVEEHLLEDRPQAAGAGAAQQRLVGDGLEAVGGELQLDVLELEHLLVLAHERVLRLGEDPHQRVAVEAAHGTHRRQAADELGDHPVLDEVLRAAPGRTARRGRARTSTSRCRGSRRPCGRCGSR